jgi:hypothetical protein
MLHDEFISQAMMNFLKWCVIEAKAVAYPERSALDDVQGRTVSLFAAFFAGRDPR